MSEKKRTSLEKYHLKQKIRELTNKERFNQSTSLVTLYIPPGTMLSDITALLRDELGTATNIKDKSTGKAVSDALKSILSRMQYLKNGENGLAIFAGITADAQKVEYFAIDDPPGKVGIKTYVCDTMFHTEHLEQMLAQEDRLGVIVIDRGGATFATIQGSNLNVLMERKSNVPGKHSKGGQSAGRIERGIELLAKEYIGRMARVANGLYLEDHPIKALVVGGPAMSKDDFLQHPFLDYRLKEKIYKVYDIGYTGIVGIRELLEKAENDLNDYAMVKERNLFQSLLEHIGLDDGKAIYGEAPVKKALEMGAVETLLFSEGIQRVHGRIKCNNCAKEFLESSTEADFPALVSKVSRFACPKCKQETLSVVSKEYLIDEFERKAIESGATLEVISIGHEDGMMLLKTFTGLAAILRFPVNW